MLISPKIFSKTQSSHVLLRSVDSFEAQNSLIKFKIRFNRISRKILLCDYVTLNPALTLSLFPEGSKEAFHTYFHPGTHFTFILRCISTSWLRGLYSGLYCILYLEGGGTIFICKIILPEVISATWCPLSRARHSAKLSIFWALAPSIYYQAGASCCIVQTPALRLQINIHIKHDS